MNNCDSRIEPGLSHRPVNGLNVEIGQPLARCMNRPPVNVAGIEADALRWLGSGGSVLAFGVCCASKCPLRANNSEA